MSKPNTVITMARAVDQFLTDEQMGRLRRLVNLVEPDTIPPSETEFSAFLDANGIEIVISGWNSPLITPAVMAANPQLKYMAHMTGTVRKMVQRESIEQGLLVTNWGNLIGPTVAEGALTGILSCLRRTTEIAILTHIKNGWKPRDNETLFRKKVGLYGFGNIARHLVGLLAPFGCDVEAFSPYTEDVELEGCGVRRQTDLQALFAANHVISIHAANTEETYHTVNAEMLAAMKDGAVLVNTARGAIIDTDALIVELKAGRIYASLDVYEKEPLPEDSLLRGLLNCQLMCHSAGPTPDSMVMFGEAAIDNIERYISDKPLERLVDVELYDLMT
jgi:phosphoglycerate dehydrogenase-like enzyme